MVMRLRNVLTRLVLGVGLGLALAMAFLVTWFQAHEKFPAHEKPA